MEVEHSQIVGIRPSPVSETSPAESRRACGVLIRKPRWGLSWQGKLLMTFVLPIAATFLVLTIHPFLAVTRRVDANVLVVEGWVHEYTIHAAVKEFRSGDYERVFATGGPNVGSGGYTWDADTSAHVAAGQLRAAGVPPESLQMVPSHIIGRDRTYYSAIALRDWFRGHDMDVRTFNVVTESTHSRRTWLLFQKAFGNKVKVGVIAIQNPDYDAKHWWRSSDGVREVVDETVAYLYAKLLFHPGKDSNQ